MYRIVLYSLLLFACSVKGQIVEESPLLPLDSDSLNNLNILEQPENFRINQTDERSPDLVNRPDLNLDTIYYPFYNGLQMIRVGHLKLYNDKYGMAILASYRMSQIPYFPPAPLADEIFFRNVEGNIVRAHNTDYHLKDLSDHFQSIKKTENQEKYHADFFIDKDPYYSSKNMGICKGFYSITNDFKSHEELTLLGNPDPDNKAKFGLIDTLGNLILDTLYDEILCIPSGFLAKKGGKWGIISENQQVLLPFEYDRYRTMYYYFDNYPMSKELTYFFKESRYKAAYFLKQDSLILLGDYHAILEPEKGLFIIKKDDKFGVIDLVNNEVLVPPIYDESYPNFTFYDPNREFYHLEYGYLTAEKNGKFGMINLKHKVILPFKYDKIYNKHECRKGFFKVELNGETIEIER